MKTYECRHAMIDLETMGLNEDAAIISIGVVMFCPVQGVISPNTFYRELDWEDQNRTIDKSAVEWWKGQNPKAKAALNGLDSLSDVLKELQLYLPTDCKPWGNGATFDISKMEHAYRQHNLEIPWKFWNIRDCRTVKDMYESARGGLDRKTGGTLHNALDDAKYQAWYICKMWGQLIGNRNGGKAPPDPFKFKRK